VCRVLEFILNDHIARVERILTTYLIFVSFHLGGIDPSTYSVYLGSIEKAKASKAGKITCSNSDYSVTS
jgi:hypothetical protein